MSCCIGEMHLLVYTGLLYWRDASHDICWTIVWKGCISQYINILIFIFQTFKSVNLKILKLISKVNFKLCLIDINYINFEKFSKFEN